MLFLNRSSQTDEMSLIFVYVGVKYFQLNKFQTKSDVANQQRAPNTILFLIQQFNLRGEINNLDRIFKLVLRNFYQKPLYK